MKEPLRAFISHKTGTHGNAARVLANILRGVSDEEKLKIFVSPELGAGTTWSEEIHEELKHTDILIVLYLAESENVKMGWCDYEAGFFAGVTTVAEKHNAIIIPVVREGATAQGPLSRYNIIQVNKDGINNLLRTIFDFGDEDKKVKPELFHIKNKDTLERLTNEIIGSLKALMRDTISPRLWITITDELLKKIGEEKNITTEELSSVHLKGESEALRDFGIGPKEGTDYGTFYKDSKYKRSIDYFVPHLLNAIKNIINEKYDDIFLPPVRVTDSGFARTLVPAYIERLPESKTRFEFFVYKPIPSFDAKNLSAFDYLFNLFVLGWRFRWLIINTTLSDLLNKENYLKKKAGEEEIRKELKTVEDRITLVLLDSLNRSIDYPRKIKKIIRNFISDDESFKKFNEIVDVPDGLWAQYSEQIFSGIRKNDLSAVNEGLKKLIPLNKQIISISLNCLLQATDKLEVDATKI